MHFMFWVWLAVIVGALIIEFLTLEMVSVWFSVGAIIPFILAGTRAVGWEIQLAIFLVVSAILIITLRGVTKRFLLRNSNEKTNTDVLIGKKVRMLKATDFETLGEAKVNDVIWSVTAGGETIGRGEIVEIVKIEGNKLVVKKTESGEPGGESAQTEKSATAKDVSAEPQKPEEKPSKEEK